MIRVTWEWLGADLALDVANTIAVSGGVEHDLLDAEGEYERWARAAGAALAPDEAAVLSSARSRILRLRAAIRDVLFAAARGEPLPTSAVDELNRLSRKGATWLELDERGRSHERTAADPVGCLLAGYARSAIEIAAAGSGRLRTCPAPSCGMFYRPTRDAQRWCSVPCGTRARVARHYRAADRTPVA
jgi:predicted RNA-binding Zn ribbon-like protein